MKTCLICSTQAPDQHFTCVACGEASWSHPAPEPEAAVLDPQEPEPEPEAAREPKAKKNAR